MKSSTETRMFALLRAMEEDGRSFLRIYLEPVVDVEDLLSPFRSKIQKRKKPELEDYDDFEFLDFGDIFEIFNRFRGKLPSELVLDLESLRSNVTKLVQLRNSVMHGRPTGGNDEDTLIQIANGLKSELWKNLNQVFEQLQNDNFEEIFEIIPEETKVKHNLPRPEHTETGLIGRKKEVEELVNLIKDPRTSVVTITGTGGVGKTAIALQVAYSFVENEEPFDLILWTSFKTEKLTVEGIVQINNARRNIEEATGDFKNLIHIAQSEAFEDLSESLKGLRTLICFDNFETITGEEFLRFYEKMPPECKFLLTSRKGIGQIERRFDLGKITHTDALHYLNKLIRNHKVEPLMTTKTTVLEGLVTKYDANPLALKWFVQSAATGRPIKEILEAEKDFIAFCLGSVLNDLDTTTKYILGVLFVLNRPVSVEELYVISKKDESLVNEGIRKLANNSIITSTIVGIEMRQLLQLTEISFKYLKNFEIITNNEAEKIKLAVSRFESDDEERIKDLENKYSPYSVTVRNENDKPIAALLREALRVNRFNPEKSLELIESARRSSPDYWEVDKVEAVIRVWNDQEYLVDALYTKALEKTNDSNSSSIVKYLYAGFLARSSRASEALQYLESIPDEHRSPEVLSATGSILTRVNRTAEGIELMERSLLGATGKSKIIQQTNLMKGYLRWAEYVLDQKKNFDEAFDLLLKAFLILDEIYSGGIRDFKVLDCNNQIFNLAFLILKKSDQMNQEIYLNSIERFSIFLKFAPLVLSDRKVGEYVRRQFLMHSEKSSVFRDLVEQHNLRKYLEGEKFKEESRVLVGKIIAWKSKGQYGFISHIDHPNNIYFNKYSFFPGTDLGELREGLDVTFELDTESVQQGVNRRARYVELID